MREGEKGEGEREEEGLKAREKDNTTFLGGRGIEEKKGIFSFPFPSHISLAITI